MVLAATAFAALSSFATMSIAYLAYKQSGLARAELTKRGTAHVVAELVVPVEREKHQTIYRFAVTNAGPAVARDVSILISVPVPGRDGLETVLGEGRIPAALLAGERRTVEVTLSQVDSERLDLYVAGAWFDERDAVDGAELGVIRGDEWDLTPPPYPT
jgi:hypothetical protein